MSRKAVLRIAAFAVAGIIGLAAGAWFSGRPNAVPDALEIGGYVLDEPREMPPFELLDGAGEPFRHVDFAGAWSFLYFGYTFCPDACPLTMVVFTRLKETLGGADAEVPIRYYLVSVDPARDTPELMGEYVAYFDPEFRGLVGPHEQIGRLTDAAGVAYIPAVAEQGDDYLVEHSSSITLLDPEGRIHAIFTPPHEPDSVAADFLRIANRYR